jgi:hypothetical protein
MKSGESLGLLIGYPLGLITGTISFLRSARMFHPCGKLVKAQVKNLNPSFLKLHPHVMIRFSSATWKYKEWPDVLGLSLRFSTNEYFSEKENGDDQDLLFASFKHPWQTPIGPLLTRFHDFFQNDLYAISPFEAGGEIVYFKITPHKTSVSEKNRDVTFSKNIEEHAVLRLWSKERKSAWQPLADITLEHSFELNQEELFFNPFRCGLKIYPRGFVHHLRIGTYKFSQKGRTIRHKFQHNLHHIFSLFTQHSRN